MADIPPLPEPGFQSADDRRAIGRRFILQARKHLDEGDRLQAGEKAWGAVAQNLKIIGDQRGWNHGNHQQLETIGRQIVEEFNDAFLAQAIGEAFHNGHRNFYENMRTLEEMEETIEAAEDALPKLESLQQTKPGPFTILSNRQLRRLMALTGDRALKIGDSSPVGFSLRHAEGSEEKAGGGDSEQ
jgi:hypothetical protein